MKIFLFSFFTLAAMLWAGCGDRQHNAAPAPLHLREHGAPHGGTSTALGSDYQIEWVLDAPSGKLQAYVLDGEMDNFVRITPPSFDVIVKLPGREAVLHLMAIPNPATGETVGSTSLFEAQAEWLKTSQSFTAVIREINVKGTTYNNVTFNFP